jgi:hypothetical protein
MAVMTRPPSPGDRRLERPPGERYREGLGEPAGGATGTDRRPASRLAIVAGSPARALVYGSLAALAGAAATVILGGIVAISAGLLVVAAVTGRIVGLATALGAGPTLGPPARPWAAVALAVLGIAVGQLGLWLYAQREGGVLGLADYLGQTFGVLVPAQVVLAALFAWWAAR